MTVDSSMSPTTIDAATLVFDPYLLNMSVGQPTTMRMRRASTLLTLDNLQCGDEPLIQESLLSDAVEALVNTGEPGVNIGKRNHWHT